MKKLLLVLLVAISAPAMADKFVIERGWGDDLATNAPNSSTWYFKGIKDINANFAMDTSLQMTQLDGAAPNNKINSRLDIGAIPKMNLYGPVNGYARFAVGEKFSSSGNGNFNYYAVEPGVRGTLYGPVWAQLGWRYRSAFDPANNDTTRTWRTSLNYDVTKQDTVGFRLDNMRGDQNQNIYNVNYVRSF